MVLELLEVVPELLEVVLELGNIASAELPMSFARPCNTLLHVVGPPKGPP